MDKFGKFGSPGIAGIFGSPLKSNGINGPSPMGFIFGRTPQSIGSNTGSQYYTTGLTPACTDSPMIFSDNGTPLSDIGDISIYSAFSPSLFSSPRVATRNSTSRRATPNKQNEDDALYLLADSCIASAEKDYSIFGGIGEFSPTEKFDLVNVSFPHLDMSGLSGHGDSPCDITGQEGEDIAASLSSPFQTNMSMLSQGSHIVSVTQNGIGSIMQSATKRKHYDISYEDQNTTCQDDNSMINYQENNDSNSSLAIDSPFKNVQLSMR
jgi:hypothetical protein